MLTQRNLFCIVQCLRRKTSDFATEVPRQKQNQIPLNFSVDSTAKLSYTELNIFFQLPVFPDTLCMLLTISTIYSPATDLGYLLHKHPARIQSFPLTFGQAHVFYPEARAERCTAALLLDVDSVGLTRRPHGRFGENFALAPYVSDRPYVASSFLSVAMSKVFSTALSGRCKERPQLADTAIPLSAKLSILPCRGGEKLLRQLFEPLGYTISATQHTLDTRFPDWGESRYFTVTLEKTCRLSELLTHLYVLIPVLDDEKHYWVGDAEIEKTVKTR